MTKAEFLRRFYLDDGGCIKVCRTGNEYTVTKSTTTRMRVEHKVVPVRSAVRKPKPKKRYW